MLDPKLKLIHYSQEKMKALTVQTVNPYPGFKGKERLPIGKPVGFWVSVEGPGSYGWSDWCKECEWEHRLKYAYEVKLAEKARILYLGAADEIDWFTEEYRDHDNPTNKLLAPIGPRFGLPSDTMYIDWGKVAKEGYQGVIITPYIWQRRLQSGNTWYYGWDCASGCIWDGQAIQSISELEVSHG